MRSAIKFIPNLITLCNILCGTVAIYFTLNGDLMIAFWLMILAALFDFSDGLAARLLNARSEIGLQLDSLCDVVSFGVLPSFMGFVWLSDAFSSSGFDWWWGFTTLLLAAFAALRLAIFNVDTEQSTQFRGVPTPAMALLVASSVVSISPSHPILGVIAVITLCALMVCRLPMLSFKLKKFDLTLPNLARYILVLATILCIIIFGIYPTPAIIIGLYIVISLLLGWLTK